MRHRSDWTRPLTLLVVSAAVVAFLFLALPPIIRFADFLLSGDVWRGLLGAALICFLVGLALAAAVGVFAERSRGSSGDGSARPTRSRGLLWALVWVLVLAVPAACIVVSLVASGTLLDVIDWVGDRVAEIRGAQS